MIFTKYGRCILIDWNKPIEAKIFDALDDSYNHEWDDAHTSQWYGASNSLCINSRGIGWRSDYSGKIYNNSSNDARIIGEVRNKPGFDLKGLDEHLNTRQEAETIYDPIEHPSHYNEGRKYETIDVIEDWNLGYHLSNALKYLSRYNRKGDGIQDLKKAVWYIQRKIKLEEK